MNIYYEQTDSTNRIARELALAGRPAGTVVQAGRQSAGRGQYGRTFDSPVGGLYFSLLLHPDLPLERLSLITLAAGLSCRDVLHQCFNLDPLIKWPNDIYLGDKKIAGILCEQVPMNHLHGSLPVVVIGIGLNVNSQLVDFPVEIQPIVTTLREHLHAEVDISALLAQLVATIIKNVDLLGTDPQSMLGQWQQWDYLLSRAVVHTAGTVSRSGIGLGVTPQGQYRVLDDQGREHDIIGGQLRPLT